MKRGSMPVFVRPWMFAALVFAFSASAANAVDMPKRKPGLWEIKTTLKGQEGGDRPPVQHCIDAKTDNMMRQSAKDDGSCTTKSVKRSGDRVTTHSVCKFGSTTATSDAVFTGKFDSNYSGDIKTKYEPPMMGMKEAHMVITAKWIGPCKPGMKPGDVIMPGMPAGMPKFNLNDLMKQR